MKTKAGKLGVVHASAKPKQGLILELKREGTDRERSHAVPNRRAENAELAS
jgi:hypothetical protein